MSVLGQLLVQQIVGGMRERQMAERNAAAAGHLQMLMGTPPEYLPAGMHGPPTPGTGLMADPLDPYNQAQFAVGLMSNQDLAGYGSSIFQTVIGQAAQDRRFAEAESRQRAQFDLSRQDQRDQYQSTFDQREDHFQRRMDERAMIRDDERMQAMHDAELAAEEARLAAGQPELGNVATGYTRRTVQGEDGSVMVVDTPLPGTDPWKQGRAKGENWRSAVENVDQVYRILTHTGRERWGEKSAELSQRYQDALTAANELAKLGVMTPGEIEYLQDSLSDPSKHGWKTANSTAAEWAQFRSRLIDRYDRWRRANQFTEGYGDLLGFDPGPAGYTAAPPGTRPASPEEERAVGQLGLQGGGAPVRLGMPDPTFGDLGGF